MSKPTRPGFYKVAFESSLDSNPGRDNSRTSSTSTRRDGQNGTRVTQLGQASARKAKEPTRKSGTPPRVEYRHTPGWLSMADYAGDSGVDEFAQRRAALVL